MKVYTILGIISLFCSAIVFLCTSNVKASELVLFGGAVLANCVYKHKRESDAHWQLSYVMKKAGLAKQSTYKGFSGGGEHGDGNKCQCISKKKCSFCQEQQRSRHTATVLENKRTGLIAAQHASEKRAAQEAERVQKIEAWQTDIGMRQKLKMKEVAEKRKRMRLKGGKTDIVREQWIAHRFDRDDEILSVANRASEERRKKEDNRIPDAEKKFLAVARAYYNPDNPYNFKTDYTRPYKRCYNGRFFLDEEVCSIFKNLIDEGIDVDTVVNDKKSNATPVLLAASRHGHVKAVRMLVQKGADTEISRWDYVGGTPLMIASRYGRAEVVRALLKAGADIGCRVRCVVCANKSRLCGCNKISCKKSNRMSCEYAHCTPCGQTVLHCASQMESLRGQRCSKVEMENLLLDRGAPPLDDLRHKERHERYLNNVNKILEEDCELHRDVRCSILCMLGYSSAKLYQGLSRVLQNKNLSPKFISV